jgi:hypothetical protein
VLTEITDRLRELSCQRDVHVTVISSVLCRGWSQRPKAEKYVGDRRTRAGLSHDIQTVAHASSPFSATIASSSILLVPLTTHPVIGDNASFSLKRPRAPSPLRTSPVRPTTRSWLTWLLILGRNGLLHGREHTVLVDVFLDSPHHIRSIEALSLKVSLATICGVGRYHNSNIVTRSGLEMRNYSLHP